MIAAAKADGHIDAKEQAAIFAEMDKLPLNADDKAFVMDELRKLDKVGYIRFASVYRSFQDVADFRDVIREVETPARRGKRGPRTGSES